MDTCTNLKLYIDIDSLFHLNNTLNHDNGKGASHILDEQSVQDTPTSLQDWCTKKVIKGNWV